MVDVPQFSKNERRFWLGGVSPHPFCSCTSKLFTFLGILQTFCAATCTSSYIRVQVVCTSFKLKQLVQCVSAARTSMASPICSTSHARGSRVMTFWAEKLRVWLWLVLLRRCARSNCSRVRSLRQRHTSQATRARKDIQIQKTLYSMCCKLMEGGWSLMCAQHIQCATESKLLLLQ